MENMDKKQYLVPWLEIVTFAAADVITSSLDGDNDIDWGDFDSDEPVL